MSRDRSHLRKLPNPGTRFGRYTLIAHVGQTRLGQRWLVRCDCGTESIVDLVQLRRAVKRGDTPRCRACGSEARIANGGATRAALAALASRYGDREAFIRHEADEEP